MKRWGVVVLAVWTVWAVRADEFRTFTAGDGRTIEARIVEYNPSRQKLKIERRSGQSAWVEPAVFSEADREYIQSWIKASEFLSPRVRVTIEKHKEPLGDKGDNIHYSVSLRNLTQSDFENLVLEYRFYTETHGYEGFKDSEACHKGTLKLDRLAAGSTQTVQTEPMLMSEKFQTVTEEITRSDGSETYDTYQQKIYDTDPVGIWFRISGPAVADGTRLVREECLPSSLFKHQKWVE